MPADFPNPYITRDFIIDGGQSVISLGEHGHMNFYSECEIEEWTLLADQPGNITIDIWKETYAGFPPTNADSICGGNEPALAGVQKNHDSVLAGWTKTINDGDKLAFNVDACVTITRVTLSLKLKRP